MQDIGRRLSEIRNEIPHKLAKHPPAVPHIEDDLELPEKNLEVCNFGFMLRNKTVNLEINNYKHLMF